MSAPPATPTERGQVQPPAPEVWNRFVRWFLLLLALQLGVVATMNYLVNPRGMHSTTLLRPVVANVRAEKAYLLKHMQPKPQALILGSSRVMKIAPATVERLTRLRTFSAGNLTAYTEDHYVTLRYAVEQAGAQPRLVLLGLELEALHDHEPMNEFLPNSYIFLLVFLPLVLAGWWGFRSLGLRLLFLTVAGYASTPGGTGASFRCSLPLPPWTMWQGRRSLPAKNLRCASIGWFWHSA